MVFVALGDFNEDGKSDLVSVNRANGVPPGSVIVALNKGDGTFPTTTNYAVGTAPFSVAVGDFNGDGKQDMAVANVISSFDVSILMGNGDGSFQSATNYPTPGNAATVAAGDFNGDGRLDLVVGGENGESILLGNGDGTFQTGITIASGSINQQGAFHDVVVADFNQDGAPDVADLTLTDLGGVGVLLNLCVPPRPELTITESNSVVTISWPYPSSGFVLQSTTSLAAEAPE
jgi:hypothetical protein